MTEASTPLMRQYAAIKKEHPQALLFFRLGDFYELFFEDAKTAARELQITLTSRNKEKGERIPMCGVPYHAAEGYIAKLIRKGYKVAICEQMEQPGPGKKLVRRDVTRVVTPGTATDSGLGADENNYLAAVAELEGTFGLAVLDLSTGEFRAAEFAGPDAMRRMQDELEQFRPKEVLYGSAASWTDARTERGAARKLIPETVAVGNERGATGLAVGAAWAETPLEDWVFTAAHAVPLLESHFGVLSLEGFGLAQHGAATAAAGAVLHYVKTTQRGSLEHVDRIAYYERQQFLMLDAVTVRNLELVEPLFADAGRDVTLFRALDATTTPMGKRLLRSWILRPAIEVTEIEQRLDAVAAGVRDTMCREELRRAFDGMQDLERLLSRVALEAATPRDVLALASSLERIPGVVAVVTLLATPRFGTLLEQICDLSALSKLIHETLVSEPPISLADGGVIRDGRHAELDEFRNISQNSKQILAQIEERERQRTGIGSLKVRFNSVFGYYIEISNANKALVPPDYDRKQTLVNAERFTTPELKEYEYKILAAQEKIVAIEKRLFEELRAAVVAEAKAIRQTAQALAEVDTLACFAHLAATRDYCRPEFAGDDVMEVVEGRHPVIEQQEAMATGERFVPNDLYLNQTTHNVLLLTGPNMGGKSTYLRQTALIAIMAQMGSFVPARSARLCALDRIFTRIGASDNLARGRSTFMVEMTETAAILNMATPRSLILLDEVGRGTSTYDGLAIAWAAVEYLHSRVHAKTLFATHYFELTELAEQLSGVKNYHVSVKEAGGSVIFLRKVAPGAADRSYGIEVAKLAGLPAEVVGRAREVLVEHETAERGAAGHLAQEFGMAAERPTKVQLTMFTPLSEQIVERLRNADLNRLTPLEAMNLLAELKQQL